MLPGSFPYGGMENPLLTFANSALVTGDKSSFRLFVHELSHSWFGNLVTNENWSNFWLNEGFTVFLERKIDSILYGVESSKVAAKVGNSSMYFSIMDFGPSNNYTSLHPDLNGNHPDTSISSIPYEKGFQFLYYLESLVGETSFQTFLKAYMAKFLKKSIVVDDFKELFVSHVKKEFARKQAEEILGKVDWQTWIYGTGMPPVRVDLDTEVYDVAVELAMKYVNENPDPEDVEKYKAFDILLKKIVLVQFLTNFDQMTLEKVAKIDEDLKFSEEPNVQLQAPWQQLAIRTGFEPSPFETADKLVGSLGRYALIVPVYTAMEAADLEKAKEIYAKHKAFYHPITRAAIEATFKPEKLANNRYPGVAMI
jgi:leukotriene-A4 hydrolase